MVKSLTNVTSLTRNGLRDWLIQRITSLVMAIYIIFLFVFFISHPHINYPLWQSLFSHAGMRLGSSLFLLSLFWHAWVGMWTVLTDYIPITGLRLILTVLIIFLLLLYFMWGLTILWGV